MGDLFYQVSYNAIYSYKMIALNTVYGWNLTPKHAQKGYWTIENQRKFFDNLAHSLNVKTQEDWKNVKLQTVIDNGGSFIFSKYNGVLARGS
jgi:hypothetical protein